MAEQAFMDTREVAEVLGVTSRTVLKMLDAGDLPWVQICRRRCVPTKEFWAWVAARTEDAVSVQRSRKGMVLNARVRRQA